MLVPGREPASVCVMTVPCVTFIENKCANCDSLCEWCSSACEQSSYACYINNQSQLVQLSKGHKEDTLIFENLRLLMFLVTARQGGGRGQAARRGSSTGVPRDSSSSRARTAQSPWRRIGTGSKSVAAGWSQQAAIHLWELSRPSAALETEGRRFKASSVAADIHFLRHQDH